MDLSICLIVKNEERCLRRCLDSVRDLSAELIVVDTGSTDTTPEIARSYGAKVLTLDFSRPDFSAARNYSLSQASGRWILVIDADERVRPSSLPLIRRLIASDVNVALHVRRYHHSEGQACNMPVDSLVRVFPNREELRFKYRVHESIYPSVAAAGVPCFRSEIELDHDFAFDLESRLRRNLWYVRIMEEEIAADPDDLSRRKSLTVCYRDVGMFDEAAALAERTVGRWPMDAEAHFNLAICLLSCSRPELQRAHREFVECFRRQPNNAPMDLLALERDALMDAALRRQNGALYPVPAPGCLMPGRAASVAG